MLKLSKVWNIHGWFTDEECKWLYAQTLGCKRVLEIGAWQGRSTYVLLSALRDTPADNLTERVVVTVDPYKPIPPLYTETGTESGRRNIIAAFLENIKEFRGVVPHLLIDDTSEVAFKHHLSFYRPFDLVFIDGDHSYDALKHDILESMKLVRPGGIICGHDYKPPGNWDVKLAVDELLPDRELGAGSCWLWKMPALK